MKRMRWLTGLMVGLIALATCTTANAANQIVLYYNSGTGAGWDAATVLAEDQYNYGTTNGKLRDAVQNHLADGIKKMTGTTISIISSSTLTSQPAGSINIVLYPDAPAAITGDATIKAALGRTGGVQPNYIIDHESAYIKVIGSLTYVVANHVDGILAAMPTLLEQKGYIVLGLGPNWMYTPSFPGATLTFTSAAVKNNGYYQRNIGGFGAGGFNALNSPPFTLTAPDESITKSYSRWRIGTRFNAGSSTPFFPGHALDSYALTVIAYMKTNNVYNGLLSPHIQEGLAASRPAAGAGTVNWLWIDSDTPDSWWSDGGPWVQVVEGGAQFSLDLTTTWVRQIVLDAMKIQANNSFWNLPDEWAIFGTDPEDGGGYALFDATKHFPTWYSTYRTAEGQAWGAYVLNGYRGIAQPTETIATTGASAANDTFFAFNNWLLREYDKYINTLPAGNETVVGTPKQNTKTGKSKKSFIRTSCFSYALHDVLPHFNLDNRIRVMVAGITTNRGVGEWINFGTRESIAGGFTLLLPNEPPANYAYMDDWGDQIASPVNYVLPHQYGNSSQSIVNQFKSFTAAGVRSWYAEMEQGYTNHALGLYLMSKYFWNTSLTIAQLDTERTNWLTKAFGAAAVSKMSEYFDWTEPSPPYILDFKNKWGKAIDLLIEADALIAAGTPEQLRLNDLKVYWYHYYLAEHGDMVSTNATMKKFMWKGQSSFSSCPYHIGFYVFGQFYLDLIPELFAPTNWTITPARYTEAETTTWFNTVNSYWPYTTVALWKNATLINGTLVSTIDQNDLVSTNQFQNYESEPAEALTINHYTFGGNQSFTYAPTVGANIGVKMLWPDSGGSNNEDFGPHNPDYTIERWNTATQAWVVATSGTQNCVAVSGANNLWGTPQFLVDISYNAPTVGTYRITLGTCGTGFFANRKWNILNWPAPLADDYGACFQGLPALDAQYSNGAMYVYVPKGTASLDFELVDDATSAGNPTVLTLYKAMPLTAGTLTRVISYTSKGTKKVTLNANEKGTFAKLDLGASGFRVPYMYSIPQTWSRSPSAMMIPRAVATADALTVH